MRIVKKLLTCQIVKFIKLNYYVPNVMMVFIRIMILVNKLPNLNVYNKTQVVNVLNVKMNIFLMKEKNVF